MARSHVVDYSTISAGGNSDVSESFSPEALPEYLRRFYVDPITKCWVWTGPPASGGHGQTWTPEGTKTAHRAVYEFFFGPLEPGVSLHHLCPTRLCVFPEHQEPKAGGKHRSDHCKAKWAAQKADPNQRLIGCGDKRRVVPESERAEIARLYESRAATQQELAVQFGISRRTVQTILHPHSQGSAS